MSIQVEVNLGSMRLIVLTNGKLWLSTFMGEGMEVDAEQVGRVLRDFVDKEGLLTSKDGQGSFTNRQKP